jgi:hypothetical protein
VEDDPDRDGDGDAEAAESDSGPGGPAAPQCAVGSVDVSEGLASDPDGGDAGQDAEDKAQQPQGERVPGAGVDRVRGDMDVRVGVHAGVRSRGEVAEEWDIRVAWKDVSTLPDRYRLLRRYTAVPLVVG